jgi:hypothetical protein
MDQKSTSEIVQDSAAPKGGGVGNYPTSASADGKVMLGRDIEIFPSKPRQEMASFETRAFEAKDNRLSGAQLALLCSRSRVPRITSLATYRNVKAPALLKLIDAGVVYWPAESRQHFCMIFEMPPGRPAMNLQDPHPAVISEDRIVSGFIHPIVTALMELKNVNIVHGALTLENIFISGEPGAENATLGECLTSAPFFRLHPIFETISRSMAQPSGRGGGSSKNDAYCLGVCVAMLMRRQNLALNKTVDQIIAGKIEYGSYSYLMGGQKAAPEIAEFLRAVLNDDEAERWDIEDVRSWAEGNKKQNVKASPQTPMGARPFMFMDHKYWDMRGLCMAFAKHVSEAAAAIESGQLLLWLKRNFDDKDLLARYGEAVQKESSYGRDRLLASVSLAMDGKAPIRYKGVAVFPDGFGVALADVIARGEDFQPYGDIVAMQYMSAWVQRRFNEIGDATLLITTFEKCRSFLTQKMPGYGLERVLYLLNKEAVCLSPVLRDFFVFTPGQLLLALETISRRPNRPDMPYDRHMIAFLSVREAKMIDPFLGSIISADRGNQVIGLARSLAAIQRRFNTGPVPGVTSWLISMVQPVIEKYNDRDLRAEMLRRVNKLSENGNLQLLLDLVDSGPLAQEDAQRFQNARREFALLTQERERLNAALKSSGGFGIASGRQTAMLTSVIISIIAMTCLVVLHFMNRI